MPPTPAKSDLDHPPEPAARKRLGLLTSFGAMFGVSIVVGAVLTFSMRPPALSEYDRVVLARAALDAHQDHEAVAIIRPLVADPPLDPRIGGTVEYIIGTIAFRDTAKLSGGARLAAFERARAYLEAAHHKAVPTETLGDWNYAIGVSCFELGDLHQAYLHLEEALTYFPAGHDRLFELLGRCYLNPNVVPMARPNDPQLRREQLQQARKFCDGALQQAGDSDSRQLLTLSVEIALNMEDHARATADLSALRAAGERFAADDSVIVRRLAEQSVMVMEARLAFSQQDQARTQSILQAIDDDRVSLERAEARAANLLRGRAAELRGDWDLAMNSYRLVGVPSDSDEGFVAQLKLARILNEEKRQIEQSYELLRDLLRLYARRPEMFFNQYLSAEDIRREVRQAWRSWLELGEYDWAVRLAEQLTPLFRTDESIELTAAATVKAAEAAQAHYDRLPFAARAAFREEVADAWRQAGQAYVRLANERRTQSNYADALWQAAELLRRGYDYQMSLRMLDAFLATQSRELLPVALVRRGELLLDIDPFLTEDQLETAALIFEDVASKYQRSPASFTAREALARVRFEQGRIDEAIAGWRSILASGELDPKAREWSASLFAIGRSLLQRAEMRQGELARARAEFTVEEVRTLERGITEEIREAHLRLEEFLIRAPQSDQAIEARWYLARALKLQAESFARQRDESETVNAKIELEKEIQRLLTRGVREFDELKTLLLPLQISDRLPPLETRILRDSVIEPAHLYFGLSRFETGTDSLKESLDRYRAAANYYPRDPLVLLSYYQMAACFDRLGREKEARSHLEQARILLQQIPPEAFTVERSAYSRDEWQRLLDRAVEGRQSADPGNILPTAATSAP